MQAPTVHFFFLFRESNRPLATMPRSKKKGRQQPGTTSAEPTWPEQRRAEGASAEQAVLKYVTARPGATAVQIVRDLGGLVKSKAEANRMLYEHQRAGRLDRDHDSRPPRWYPVSRPPPLRTMEAGSARLPPPYAHAHTWPAPPQHVQCPACHARFVVNQRD